VVEDFFQDLVDNTPTEWLLRLIGSQRREATALHTAQQELGDHFDPRSTPISLSEIFESIHCETLYLPSTKRSALRNLQLESEENLEADFLVDMQRLRSAIYSSTPKLRGKSEPLRPPEMVALLRLIVTGSNENLFPRMPSMWSSFLALQSHAAVEDCVSLYESWMRDELDRSGVISDRKLQQLHAVTWSKLAQVFKEMLFGLPDVYQHSLALLEVG
jgi:hypothetical protein